MHCSTFLLHIKHSAPPSQLSLRHISDFNITPPPSLLSGIKHRENCRQLPPTLEGFSASEQIPSSTRETNNSCQELLCTTLRAGVKQQGVEQTVFH